MSKQPEKNQQPETTNPLDPFDTLNTMRDASLKTLYSMRNASLETWSKMMIDLVNSESYSQATSQWLDSYLTLSQPFQRIIETTMTQSLARLTMPLRPHVTTLPARLTTVKHRLTNL